MMRNLRRIFSVGTLLLGLLTLAAPVVAQAPPEVAGAWVGLGGQYKLGCWAPLRVAVAGGDVPASVQVIASTPDSDGVGYATRAPGGRPISTEPGRISESRLYIRFGKQDAPLEVQLLGSGGRVGQRKFSVHSGSDDGTIVATSSPEERGQRLSLPVASTATLVLQVGADIGTDEALATLQPSTGRWQNEQATAMVATADDLPRDAIGYDSFNAVILVAGRSSGEAAGGWLGELDANDERLQALAEWVESGGRLIISCGAGGAGLLASGGPLADFVPGTYEGPQAITVATGIERYAEASPDDGSLDLLGGTLTISKLSDLRGTTEAYAGRDASESPLVVRTPRGFGEVTFVAFDLDAPAIAGWKGRTALVAQLLQLSSPDSSQQQANQGWGGYQEDFTSQLVRKLDAAFAGVQTAPFLLIVGLVVLYLLLIGPGDYFLVKRLLGRVEATWVTFPLLVLATSAAAYMGAYWLKGDKLRVNQVEMVDTNVATGETRGTLLTHIFSPRASRYDLSLATRSLDGTELKTNATNTAWLGKPGYGLGAMQASSNSGTTGVRVNYQINATPLIGAAPSTTPTIAGLPIQVWSTKTLVSRYGGVVDRSIDVTLSPDGDGLVEGSITNDTGTKLSDCRLLYGVWAWKLGDLGDGATKEIDTSLSPLKITTLIGNSQRTNAYRDWTIDSISEFLAVGARATGANGPGSRYLHNLDLTHRLDAGDALLLTRVEGGPRSELVRPDGPLINADDETETPQRRSWVYARFILPADGT